MKFLKFAALVSISVWLVACGSGNGGGTANTSATLQKLNSMPPIGHVAVHYDIVSSAKQFTLYALATPCYINSATGAISCPPNSTYTEDMIEGKGYLIPATATDPITGLDIAVDFGAGIAGAADCFAQAQLAANGASAHPIQLDITGDSYLWPTPLSGGVATVGGSAVASSGTVSPDLTSLLQSSPSMPSTTPPPYVNPYVSVILSAITSCTAH